MKKILYPNKLIRDNIPADIEARGARYSTRILNAEDFERELKKKLIEESTEVANEREHLVGELADVLELIKSIAQLSNIPFEQVEVEQTTKRKKKGAFEKKLFLEWVEEN